MVGDPAKFGIITISDRAHSGEYEDEGGPAILDSSKKQYPQNGLTITS